VRGSILAACAAATLSLSACGNERGQPPDLDRLGRPGATAEFVTSGIRFRHPSSWVAQVANPPQYAQLASGGALAAVYAYPRSDLGTDRASVEAARSRLVESLHRRAPGFLIERTRLVEIDGTPAVEVRGRGKVAGERVESRSVHVYKPAVEWVIDAYARPAQFAEANRVGFSPMLASIKLSDRAPAPGRGAKG
jgi:hypothetical protein